MNSSQAKVNLSDSAYYSVTGDAAENADVSQHQSQLECLKKSLKIRMEELKEQEEFTKDLEEELARTKLDLTALQEKYEKQERRSRALGSSSVSEPSFNWHYTTLSCAMNKIEETLQSLTQKHNCGLSNCRGVIEEEIKKIRSLKDNLRTIEKKSKNLSNAEYSTVHSDFDESRASTANYYSQSEVQGNNCSLIHLDDVEVFREKAASGIATLEQMKEQICVIENLIKKYTENFPCGCDKFQVESCENKLEKLHAEFDDITDQLCSFLGKLREGSNASFDSCDLSKTREESINTDFSLSFEDVTRLKCEYEKLQKDICDQENAAERLRKVVAQLEEELECKRTQLAQHSREMNDKVHEILRVKDLVRRVCCRLREMQGSCPHGDQKSVSPTSMNSTSLSGLFCDLQELWGLLDKSMNNLLDAPKKLMEDNEKLRSKLGYLEKCICNKEETLRLLQDTLKLRECQIEDLKSKMESSENQSSKLAQDMEEKCRLIANLQEAIRRNKQFEVNAQIAQVESLQFELCDLDHRLRKFEKEVVIKNRKIEDLHNKITELSSRNCHLIEKIRIIEPKFKTMYKTCQLFEKMVSDLQGELNTRECDVEGLCGKIKELESELEAEFKKCEIRAAEDSKCIEDLSLTLKNFQNELSCARDNYNTTINETEQRLEKERQMSERKESELNQVICQLKGEIMKLKSQLQESGVEAGVSNKISDLECSIRQAEAKEKAYERKLRELQRTFECAMSEADEERKGLLEKLCEAKKENLKNKSLITKLNENIRRKGMNEKCLKDCIQHFRENNNTLKTENMELKIELEARKKVMNAMERKEETNLSDLEEILCQLKTQKADLKTNICNLKAELEKETKLKRLFECQVDDLNSLLQGKLEEFSQLSDNYKCTSSRLQQTLMRMKEVEENITSFQGDINEKLNDSNNLNECEYLRSALDMKTGENAKLISQVQILKVELELAETERAFMQANKDSTISNLRHEVSCLENELQDLENEYDKLNSENKALQVDLEHYSNKEFTLQNEFREKQKELCVKLRTTICEKNDLLKSLDELQKHLEHICLENVNKEKINRELSEECSRLKGDTIDSQGKNKSDKIICKLTREVKNLNSELFNLKEDYNNLSRDYEAVVEQLKCTEKKKSNLEKLYMDVSNENKELLELRMKYERELCELKTQNLLLKDMKNSKGECGRNAEEKKKLCDKIKELTIKVKTLEKRLIPDLEQEIAEKNCCIENLKIELGEANISSQRMRNEALRVIQHTRKYLAAQRCANDTLKSRLECSNKRGNMLGAENRELEDQLKAVTRMNEFLLCQLESAKNDVGEIEPRSYSPLPWGCSTVERDTSSSEYMAESGIQSMQPSPTNMDHFHDNKYDSKRGSPQCNSLRKNKCGGSVEYTMSRSGVR